MQFGRSYEEFEVGAVYKHWPGKTVTEYDDHLFCLLTMNHHPLHLDANYAAETTDFGQNVVVGNYIYSLLLGMSVPDVSGKAIANLEIESLRHVAPTFHGDTIYGETTVLGKWPSKSKSDRGIVEVETRGYKQDGTLVCVFRRKVMVPTETYIKERGGEQPGRPGRPPEPLTTSRNARSDMERLAQTEGLTETQRDILATVRDFVDKEIIPVATELEHKDEYPTQIVEGMKELGLFGLTIAEEYGGIGESLLTYALVVEQIARGWMSVSGIVNTHFIVAYMISQHGTQEQKDYFLPKMAAGEVRGAFSMSEPGVGSDVSAIRTKAVPDGDGYVINGQKMWLTNGGTANLVAVLCRTDEGHDAPHRNMTTFLIEKEPGFGANLTVPGLTVPGKIEKMGYKGVDTTELILRDVRVPAGRVLGGAPGQGFYQMMDGVEVGRVNVAARGCGVALRAFELAIAYAQQRHTFGKPIAEHQAIQFKLAEMATKVEAAHQMMVMAARRKDSGQRNDLEAGMAKYLASEYGKEVVEDSFRIHGGYGFSKEYEIERLYREVPMLLIGEGTAEIQKMIIGRRLLEEYRIAE